MEKIATIIGTRNPTKKELLKLKKIAEDLHEKGYILRSGGAKGCDAVINHLENVEIYIPWEGYNDFYHDGKRVFVFGKSNLEERALEIVGKIHPYYNNLSQGVKKLHARNVFQIFGFRKIERSEATSVVHFVADEKNGVVKGGTATAVNIARKLKILTHNHRENIKKEG